MLKRASSALLLSRVGYSAMHNVPSVAGQILAGRCFISLDLLGQESRLTGGVAFVTAVSVAQLCRMVFG